VKEKAIENTAEVIDEGWAWTWAWAISKFRVFRWAFTLLSAPLCFELS